MTEIDLVREVSRVCELPFRESGTIVQTILDAVAQSVLSGGTVEVRGFGTFWVHTRRARRSMNPKTRVRVQVPEKKIARFRASNLLLESLNHNE